MSAIFTKESLPIPRPGENLAESSLVADYVEFYFERLAPGALELQFQAGFVNRWIENLPGTVEVRFWNADPSHVASAVYLK